MTEKELIDGKRFFFNNEDYQNSIGGDDIREATVWHDYFPNWAKGFKILFNGRIIHTNKTFKSLENKLNRLIDKWHLIKREEL